MLTLSRSRTTFIDENAGLMRHSRDGENLLASIRGHGTFTVTAEAVNMIDVFGGILHCYQGNGGCRK